MNELLQRTLIFAVYVVYFLLDAVCLLLWGIDYAKFLDFVFYVAVTISSLHLLFLLAGLLFIESYDAYPYGFANQRVNKSVTALAATLDVLLGLALVAVVNWRDCKGSLLEPGLLVLLLLSTATNGLCFLKFYFISQRANQTAPPTLDQSNQHVPLRLKL